MTENKNIHDDIHVKYMYTQEEMEDFQNYVEENIGHIEYVFHEIVSDTIHLDVLYVAPSEQQDCYRLITMGAGAYRMNFPSGVDFTTPRRVEYVFCLPKEWPIKNMEEEYYWPTRWLKKISRMPSQLNDWFAAGHTIQANEDFSPFHESTKLNGVGMLPFADNEGYAAYFETSSEKIITFLQLLPLYDAELRFAMKYGLRKLTNKMPEDIVTPKETLERKNYAL